ncbi:hypothetical protein BEH94_11655 [Candidatus Altiarchaeales archaeon WOR_SM1_SCG]|nr:hypothetical protein BEH94_11655 [Candidatus Altiarchaeales archaeon WOR_SM1_SCG]
MYGFIKQLLFFMEVLSGGGEWSLFHCESIPGGGEQLSCIREHHQDEVNNHYFPRKNQLKEAGNLKE